MKQIQILTLSAALIGSLTLGTAFAAQQGQTQVPAEKKQAGSEISRADREFLKEAAQLGQAEVALAKVAQEKASNPEIKRLAQDLVSGHTKANQELSQLALNKGVDIATQPSAMARGRIQGIEKAQGERFDKEFQDQVIKDHRHSIAIFEKAAKSSSDPDVKAWAQKMIPALEQHLAMAQKPTAVGEAPKGQRQQQQQMPRTEPKH